MDDILHYNATIEHCELETKIMKRHVQYAACSNCERLVRFRQKYQGFCCRILSFTNNK